MDKREKFIHETVERVQSIQTLDDFMAAREEILDLMENVLKAGMDSLGNFIKNMFSMSPEEKQETALKFQDDNYLISKEIMDEIDNLTRIPGIEDHVESFSMELEKRLSPYMEEYAEKLGQHMDQFMSSMVGDMAESMGVEEIDDEEEDHFEFDYDNPDTPVMLYDLYAARSLEDLKDSKDSLIENMVEDLQSDIWDAEVLADMNPSEYIDRDREKIGKMRHSMERLIPEMDKELNRIASLSGEAEEVGKIKLDIMDKVSDKISELDGYLKRIK